MSLGITHRQYISTVRYIGTHCIHVWRIYWIFNYCFWKIWDFTFSRTKLMTSLVLYEIEPQYNVPQRFTLYREEFTCEKSQRVQTLINSTQSEFFKIFFLDLLHMNYSRFSVNLWSTLYWASTVYISSLKLLY